MLLKTKPLLSVIVPIYNVEKYINQSIDSILSQTFVDFELIIVDDGSSDNSRNIVDKYSDSRIIFSHNRENMGKVKSVNRAFESARGRYITIHDSDDWSDCDRFERQISWLEEDSNRVMCGTGYIAFDRDRDEIEKFIPIVDYQELKEAIKVRGQFHGPTMMFRADAISSKIYREYFDGFGEDSDLAYRLLQKGVVSNIKNPFYHYRILSTSLCRREFTIRNRHLYRVIVKLAQQREESGKDDLMRGDRYLVDEYLASITTEYIVDKSLIYREGASYYIYWNDYKKAIIYSIKAIVQSPFMLLNWRTLIYCIKRAILK